jgi:hypothetical protein
MSLSISLTTEHVEQRLSKLGIPCQFSPEERDAFLTTPVVTGPVAVFGFPTPAANSFLTLSNIKKCVGSDPAKQPSIFDHPWFADEAFMAAPCAPGWHFISVDVLPDSIGQTIDYARRLEAAALELPTAVEVAIMLFLHYVGTGEQLLLRKHTWCSDLASLDRHVTVGAFGRNGLFLSSHPSGFASRGLGICAKVKG